MYQTSRHFWKSLYILEIHKNVAQPLLASGNSKEDKLIAGKDGPNNRNNDDPSPSRTPRNGQDRNPQ